jgi:hypothetical protein
VIKDIPVSDLQLISGEKFFLSFVLEKSESAKFFELQLFDPNTEQRVKQTVEIKMIENCLPLIKVAESECMQMQLKSSKERAKLSV